MPQHWTDIYIAPDFTIADWHVLRGQLTSGSYDHNWETVISHISNRLRKRFLDPAAALLQHEDEKMQKAEGLGFSVVAIDCLLVETLIGYERGERTKVRETATVFKDFLSTTPGFAEAFAQGNRAETFSTAIRNGILHDGETRKGWIIWKGSADGPLVADWGDGLLRLYRDAFHSAVEKHFNRYIQRLREPGSHDLRANLKKRIDKLVEESAPD